MPHSHNAKFLLQINHEYQLVENVSSNIIWTNVALKHKGVRVAEFFSRGQIFGTFFCEFSAETRRKKF